MVKTKSNEGIVKAENNEGVEKTKPNKVGSENKI